MSESSGVWQWYIAGPLIGLFVPALLLAGNKLFGISSSFEHICHISIPKKWSEVVKYNAQKNSWKFYFVIGIAIGGFISAHFISAAPPQLLPESSYSLGGLIKLFIGGILVGFGTRYGNGCTSGHAITGLSLLNPASLKATISFFVGGLIYTFLAFQVF